MSDRILKVIIFLTSISIYSQNSNEKFLLELKQQKVDTICVYENYSIGNVQIIDKENEKDYCEFKFENIPTFIIWKKNGETFLTKTDNCFEYSVNKIDADKIWKNYFENKKTIQVEKIKNFQYAEIQNGKKVILTMMIDHSHHQNFKFIVKDKIIEKRFDDFDFQKVEESSDEKEININYKHNISLKSKVLVDEINKLILKNERLLTKKRI
jgi:hypothetical protein